MAQASRSKSKNRQRHKPLEEDLVATGNLRVKSNKRKIRPDAETEGYVDSKSSCKILKIGRELVEEDEKENGPRPRTTAFDFDSRQTGELSEEDAGDHNDGEAWGDEEELVEEVEVDPNEMDLFNKFHPLTENALMQATGQDGGQTQSTNLTDLILEKIAAHEAANGGQPGRHDESEPEDQGEIPPKVVEVYSK